MVLRSHPFLLRAYAVLDRVSPAYPPLTGRSLRVTHPFATRRQRSKLLPAAVRLACVKRAASVQSEPGSNSSLEFFLAFRPKFSCLPCSSSAHTICLVLFYRVAFIQASRLCILRVSTDLSTLIFSFFLYF